MECKCNICLSVGEGSAVEFPEKCVTVSFPHEVIRGSDFFSAQVDAFPYHEWPKATSDREMHQRVLRKSQTRELPHVEKAFSNVAINKLVNLKIT